ncbi:Transcriptional regulator OS=Streptomyces antimycoticus OX=68175 GN=SANT12839_037430 PE=4 SV=1 [Streptomyces antimycoticus]
MAKTSDAQPQCPQPMPHHQHAAELTAAAPQPDHGAEQQRDGEALNEPEVRNAVLTQNSNTNPENTSKPFVTVSTVQQHLTRIHRKHNVKRRRDRPANHSDSSRTGTR